MKKLILAKVALSLSLLLLMSSIAYAANIEGDANGDGVVNILDLTLVASHFGESVDPSKTPNPLITEIFS